jgi:tRNA(Ile)-lysidine synthase
MIVARVRRTICDRRLVEPGMCVLAACSGGPDSAAMLVALARLREDLGFALEVASVDHGLRPGAAADIEVAAAQASAQGVAFHRLRVAVDPSGSLQARAREARYDALRALAARIGAQRIAVGHTLDDQAETVLMRMLRGAGLHGLAGIEPARADGVVRPLIDCSRREVLAFAVKHCAVLAKDPSNDDPRFERVRIRHALLPLLEREDSAVIMHLNDLADDARAASRALDWAADRVLADSRQDDESIDLSSWTAVPDALRRRALSRWLERATGLAPGRAHLEALSRGESGSEVRLGGGYTAHIHGDGILRLTQISPAAVR